jgi:hypothetical protein
MKPVAILGAGPAGLMAAHAVALEGIPIVILSQPDKDGNVAKSRLGGAQFLHSPIPMVNDDMEATTVTYKLRGDVLTYRHKVYGDDPNIPFVSMEGVTDGKEQQAWNLQATYDRLWDLLGGDSANAQVINPAFIDEALKKEWFSAIISTVPAQAICQSYADMAWHGPPHAFVSQKVLIHNECILQDLPDNTVFYNGDLSQSWYRCSKLYGYGSTEWSSLAPRPPQNGLVEARKPLRTNCDCYEGKVLKLGRMGTWTKGVLTHHAFQGAKVFAETLPGESAMTVSTEPLAED